MGKKWLVVTGAVGLTIVLATVAFAANPIKLIVNGQEIKPDVPPQLIGGRTMVPIRWVAEALGADVQWDEQNRTVIVSLTEKLEADLISNYLRTADTPKHFVENFARALQGRNGAVARLFLTPEIREQIKPEVIGTSTPVKEIEINEATASENSYRYNIKAYYGPYEDQPPALAFEMNLTVEPEKYPDGSVVPGRYFVTKLEASHCD
ncbi:copper amine oxidase N-terminal domain-containing protein [Syntrophothermus lipocalidus]|uniref:Copper amine oxidase domain protein n=1 Tax=Syntrophothermus lipocalidus (strain DSM 12680 / TGB-C1) TaxID=643648 RepID=D7CMI7_SYNLT|nr:copper amine oxidase N-terminal domain-containing protein [Syntrophothermus lipocalidus]ADI01922.1 copper amine oxidase domain protein [Syntrophothermus lipocalidus DSM 12680]